MSLAVTRRGFLKTTALGIGAFVAFPNLGAVAGEDRPLVDRVRAVCARLAPLGWRQLLLDATGGELDIEADPLGAELGKGLTRIDRSYPGFGDFALSGSKGIEAGRPERSLLYHALASPTVVADRSGNALRGFPTLAEIEAVENYVYGVAPPTLEDIRRQAGGRPLGMVVFAPQYQSAPMSVHSKHAELCFSRTGITRLGTLEPLYDGRARNFVPLDDAQPFEFRVVPRRFVAFLAIQMQGASEAFGPQDVLPEDKDLPFWVPIHKLFSGRECIAGLDLRVELTRGLRNDGLAQFHRFLDLNGLKNNWRGEDLENFPFTIKDERIGSLSERPDFGDGVLEPRPNPLLTPAQYDGRLLTFPVDGRYTSDPENLQLGAMQIMPVGTPDPPPGEPRYMLDAFRDTQRPAPEYINIRHRVLPNGQIENLNLRPDMDAVIKAGGYDALHYFDGVGDGWVEVDCPQLKTGVDWILPAYCTVGLPDFFPKVTQRDLMVWWQTEVPEPIRDALWAIHPLALSQTRMAGNITLPVGFSLEDTTITAIVTQPTEAAGEVQHPNGPWEVQKTGLPDGSPGLFDPGWDTSQGIYYTDPHRPLQKFMAGYGLGSPFIEDAKLCAALGAYWPGVAPDSTRTFAPDKGIGGEFYPYPTIIPLTDQEIGSAPLEDGSYLPWDGVRGPKLITVADKPVVAYPNAYRVDYIDTVGTMTAALTSRVDTPEYRARIMAMAGVYWALGIHDPEFLKHFDKKTAAFKVLQAKAAWSVLSFQSVKPDDAGLLAAEKSAGVQLSGTRRYSFHVIRWGDESAHPDDMNVVLLEVLEQARAYVSDNIVLIQREDGPWIADTSMPT
ncbi:MAG TPA: twin-arginine translocation signal domain-containing protein [Kaistia sp.]|nr:twin-arginine translocation signal domain-containing protein [Kaistia sp.]